MFSKNRMRQVKVKSAVGWRDLSEPFLLSGRWSLHLDGVGVVNKLTSTLCLSLCPREFCITFIIYIIMLWLGVIIKKVTNVFSM